MSQSYTWPPVLVTATNPSVGVNGITAPTSATEVAGINPSGNLQPLQTDGVGSLITTQATGALDNVNLAEVGGVAISLGQKLEAASIPVVLPSDQVVPISATALPLPIGASTSALQTSGNGTLVTIASNQTNGTQVTAINNFPATQPVSGTVTVVQPTGTNLHTVVDSSALPIGASTSALQSSILANQTNGTQVTSVNNFPATQPVSGTVAVSNFPATQPISAVSLPLPTNAAQETGGNLASINSNITSRLSGALVPTAYDEIDLTYITSGNGTGQIGTALYKLATVLVKTLTITYDSSDRISTVVAS